jgi:hypothetical protein
LGFIDIAIPLVIGLLLALRPQVFYKPTGAEADIAKAGKLRNIGFLLIGVAALYGIAKLASG